MAYPEGQYSDEYIFSIPFGSEEYNKLSFADKERYKKLGMEAATRRGVGYQLKLAQDYKAPQKDVLDEARRKWLKENAGITLERYKELQEIDEDPDTSYRSESWVGMQGRGYMQDMPALPLELEYLEATDDGQYNQIPDAKGYLEEGDKYLTRIRKQRAEAEAEEKRQKRVEDLALKEFQKERYLQKNVDRSGARGLGKQAIAVARFYLPRYMQEKIGLNTDVVADTKIAAGKANADEQQRIIKKLNEGKPTSEIENKIAVSALAKGYIDGNVGANSKEAAIVLNDIDHLLFERSKYFTKEQIRQIQKLNDVTIKQNDLNKIRQKTFSVTQRLLLQDMMAKNAVNDAKLSPEEFQKVRLDRIEKSRAEALRVAETINFTIASGDPNYRSQKIKSDIVDWENNIILKDGVRRKATPLEMLTNAFKPQVIQTAAERDASLAKVSIAKALRADEQEKADQDKLYLDLKKKINADIHSSGIDLHFNLVNGDISKLKDKYPNSYKKYKAIQNRYALDEEGNITDKALEIAAEKKDEGFLQSLLIDKKGPELTETTFAALLRGPLNIAPGAIHAFNVALPGKIYKGDQKIDKERGFYNQWMINVGTLQGVGEAAELRIDPDAFPIQRSRAKMQGYATELVVPATGLFTLARNVGKAGRATSFVLKNADAPTAAKAVRIVTNPAEAWNINKVKRHADKIANGAGTKAVKELYSSTAKGADFETMFKKNALQNTLYKRMGEITADNVSSPFVVNGFIKSNPGSLDTLDELMDMEEHSNYIKKLFDETKEHVQDPLKRLEKIQDIAKDDILNLKITAQKQANKGDTSLNNMILTAQDAGKILENRNTLKTTIYKKNNKTGRLEPNVTTENTDLVREITALNEGLIKETFLINFADKIAKGQYSEKELAKMAEEFANVPANKRTIDTLAAIIRGHGYDFIPTDLKTNLLASKGALAKEADELFSNLSPIDFVIIGNDTAVLRSFASDKKRIAATKKDWKELIDDNITPKIIKENGERVVVLKIKDKDKLFAALTQEIGGPNVIAQSKAWQEILSKMESNKALTMDEFLFVKGTIEDHLAKKHMDGKALNLFGDQAKKAKTDKVIQDSLFPSTLFTGSDKPLGWTPGLGQALKQFVKINKTKDLPSRQDLTRLHTALNDIAEESQSVFKKFVDEVNENKKNLDPREAANKVFNDTWKTQANDVAKNTDDFVNRNFGGSYKAYLDYILTTRDKNRHTTIANQIRKIVRKNYPDGDVPEEFLRNIILDYDTYLTKLDVWENLIKKYYGGGETVSNLITNRKHLSAVIKKPYREGKLGVGEQQMLRARASNVFDPNVDTFREIIRRLESAEPELAGKAVVKPRLIAAKTRQKARLNKDAPIGTALLSWALQQRQGRAAQIRLQRFVDENPRQVLNMIQDPNIGEMNLKYGKDLYKEYAEIAKTIPGADAAFIDKFADQMAQKHIQSIARLSPNDRLEMIKWMMGSMIRQGTMDLNIKSLMHRANMIAGDSVVALENTYNSLLKNADLTQKQKDTLFKEINRRFLGFNNVNTSLGSDAFGQSLKQLRSTLKGSGAVDADNLLRKSLRINRMNAKNLKGANVALIYGPEFSKTLHRLEDMLSYGKLDTHLEKLTPADKTNYTRAVLNILDDARRLGTASMLGGAWMPGLVNIVNNIVGMPTITAVTLGNRGAMTAIASPGAALKKLKHTPDDAIVFTNARGRSYTNAELKYLMGKHNLGLSQSQVVLSDTVADEVFRDLGLYVSGMPKGKAKNIFSKYVDPRYKNIYHRINIGVDQHIRNQVFIKGLMEGKTPEQAAALARRSIFDYSALNQNAKNMLSRFMLFTTFRIENIKQTINGAYRILKDDKPNMLMSYVRLQNQRLQDADAWYHSSDETKMRLHPIWKALQTIKKDDSEYLASGPRIPALEVVNTLAEAINFTMSDSKKKNVASVMNKIMTEPGYRPSIELLIDIAQKDDQWKGQRVPDKLLYFLRNTNNLDWFEQYFPMEDIEFDKRDFDKPTYFGRRQTGEPSDFPYATQKRFLNKNVAKNWAITEWLLMLAGAKQPIYSSAGALMAEDIEIGPDVFGLELDLPLTPGSDFGIYSLGTGLESYSGTQRYFKVSEDKRKQNKKLDFLMNQQLKKLNQYNTGKRKDK
jgi:hypothetical protein